MTGLIPLLLFVCLGGCFWERGLITPAESQVTGRPRARRFAPRPTLPTPRRRLPTLPPRGRPGPAPRPLPTIRPPLPGPAARPGLGTTISRGALDAVRRFLGQGLPQIATSTVRRVLEAEDRAASAGRGAGRGGAGMPGVAGRGRPGQDADEPGTPQGRRRRGRGGQPSFSAVSAFLGSRRGASGLAQAARASLATLDEINRRFNLGQAGVRALTRTNVTVLASNPMAVLPDTAFDLLPTTFSTCPFPADSSQSRAACNRRARRRYRTLDGTCNNLGRPLEGRSLTPLIRFLDPDYADGYNAPRSGSFGALPSARLVSTRLCPARTRNSPVHTLYLMLIGQFLDHDITRTAISTLSSSQGYESDVMCGADGCSSSRPSETACFPITVPPGDPDFTSRCLMFVRTQAVPRRDCRLGPRQQLNQITHYIDASNVYGSTMAEADGLRDPNRARGRLLTSRNPRSNLKRLLPQSNLRNDPECPGSTSTTRCFLAGDGRVNENVGLSTIHLIMVRLHNQIEGQLNRLNPHWDGERLYQETRKIVGALWQHIVYNEYLPLILGPNLIRRYRLDLTRVGYSRTYAPRVSAEIGNVFATAAFRASHSMVSDRFTFNNQRYNRPQTSRFSDVLLRPNEVYNNGRPAGSGADAITLGAISQAAPHVDRFFSKEITARLFSDGRNPGTDLVALNIQRGRDHGLPSYNSWRRWCGLHQARSFNELRDIRDFQARQALQRLYRSVNDIDVYAGAMSEQNVPGGQIGPTFGCILARQFRNSRAGDRFWYENSPRPMPGLRSGVGFSSAQLAEIRKITLAKLICKTLDRVETIQKFVMLQPLRIALRGLGGDNARLGNLYALASLYRGDLNERRPCCALPDIDLTKWREFRGRSRG